MSQFSYCTLEALKLKTELLRKSFNHLEIILCNLLISSRVDEERIKEFGADRYCKQ